MEKAQREHFEAQVIVWVLFKGLLRSVINRLV
jgi:hypothetical protein